jgi:hypothetical protein
MTMERRDDDKAPDLEMPVEAAQEAGQPQLGWIRRFADQWAESRRGAQKAQDRPGDSLRK